MDFKANFSENLLAYHNDNWDDYEFDVSDVVYEWCKEHITDVDDGDWIDDGKYSNRSVVYGVKFDDDTTDYFYEVSDYRSGSYFSDYDYGDSSINRVYPHTITKTIYTGKP